MNGVPSKSPSTNSSKGPSTCLSRYSANASPETPSEPADIFSVRPSNSRGSSCSLSTQSNMKQLSSVTYTSRAMTGRANP